MAEALLALPAGEGARHLLARYLDEARAACARLGDPADEEALHDFRVALRRMRSTERAYREHLGDTLDKKLRRRIRAVATATGPARDVEVQLAWLEDHRDLIRSHERPGFQWLYRRMREHCEREYALIRGRMAEDFQAVRARLEERLALNYRDDGPLFGAAAAALIREATLELEEHLSRVHGESDEAEVHQARLAGKRIRYLLEPVREEIPRGVELVQELKGLQDLLGDIHDTQVLSLELKQAAEEAGAARFRQLIELSLRCAPQDPELESARRQDERAGLMSLARELHEQRQDLFSRLLAKLESGDANTVVAHLLQGAQVLEREEAYGEGDVNDGG